MPALDKVSEQSLDELKQRNLLRRIESSERQDGVYVVRNGKKLISFSCNDYFGLSQHPKLINANIQATQRYGTGAGASRLITGSNPLYAILENELKKMKQTEDACVFGSGYLANIGTISAIVGKGDLIIADKLIHACIIDGAKLSGARLLRFNHNDSKSLEIILKKQRNSFNNCLIATETIFSMDGDFAPLDDIVRLAQEYDCWTVTDDAHGIGITRPNNKIDIQMGTLSKGVGAYGGYICGRQKVIDHIRNKARSLIFSTALPPGTIAAAIEGLKLIAEEPSRVAKPVTLCNLFADLLSKPRINSAIFPHIVGSEKQALYLSQLLEENGFFVCAIRPPTVPRNSARLRFTFSSMHNEEYVRKIVELLKP